MKTLASEVDLIRQLDESHIVDDQKWPPAGMDNVLSGGNFNAIGLIRCGKADVVGAEHDVEEAGVVGAVFRKKI